LSPFKLLVAAGPEIAVGLSTPESNGETPSAGPAEAGKSRPGDNEGLIGVLSLSDNSYQPAYPAAVGWDFATGFGLVNVTNLVLNPIWATGAD